jgi:hypothetical protein
MFQLPYPNLARRTHPQQHPPNAHIRIQQQQQEEDEDGYSDDSDEEELMVVGAEDSLVEF